MGEEIAIAVALDLAERLLQVKLSHIEQLGAQEPVGATLGTRDVAARLVDRECVTIRVAALKEIDRSALHHGPSGAIGSGAHETPPPSRSGVGNRPWPCALLRIRVRRPL